MGKQTKHDLTHAIHHWNSDLCQYRTLFRIKLLPKKTKNKKKRVTEQFRGLPQWGQCLSTCKNASTLATVFCQSLQRLEVPSQKWGTLSIPSSSETTEWSWTTKKNSHFFKSATKMLEVR